MNRRGEPWYDDEAGPLVRPFAVTRGRTQSHRADLNMITLVMSTSHAFTVRLEPEEAELVWLAQVPQSIAELSAKLRLPLAVTKILAGDLLDDGFLIARSPSQTTPGGMARPDVRMMQAVLDGLRKI